MIILHLVLDIYFAAMLGVSGLAKLESPSSFAGILRQQRIVPKWGIVPASHVLPWSELALASALIVGLLSVPIAFMTLALFVGFLGIETYFLITGRNTNCGCYGALRKRPVDRASVITSGVLVLLAVLHTWAALRVAPLAWGWRLPAIAVFCGMGGWLGWRIISRRNGQTRSLSPEGVTSIVQVFDYSG